MKAGRSHRTTQTAETKAIIRKAKKDIDAGRDWREVMEQIEFEDAQHDSIQIQKIRKAIIEYV